MKKECNFLLLAILLPFFLLSMQESKKAILKFDHESLSLGKLKKGEHRIVKFRYVNAGMQPLIISSVDPTCNCTIAQYTKLPVMEGKQGYVSVKFHANVKGIFKKKISITSNALTPLKEIYITGEVTSN